MAALLTSRKAEYLLVELALPGRPVTNLGVLLFDPSTDRVVFKLRQDIEALAEPEDAEVISQLTGDFGRKIEELGGRRFLEYLEDSLSNVLRISERRPVEARSLHWKLHQLFNEHVRGVVREPVTVIPFVTHLPLWSLEAAAGGFGPDEETELEDWVEAPPDLRLTPDMFVAHVSGRSMEPLIADGSLCLFRRNVTGTRQGKLLLIQRLGASESGGEFTVKRYRSQKVPTGEGSWRHEIIRLEPLNPDFEAWELQEGPDFKVRGEFLRVLTL
jgi:SOS-response transcriptional repressor LexA